MSDIKNEENWEALARFLAGESTDAEREEVHAWAEADPRHAEVLEAARRTWSAAGNDGWDTASAWSRVQARLDSQPATPRLVGGAGGRVTPRSGWMGSFATGAERRAVAAVVATLLAGGSLAAAFWAGAKLGGGPVAVQELVTPKRGRADARLADGTRVVLGPDSRISLAAGFGDSLREVELMGEAFFEVAPDPSRPFVVRSGSTVTRVLGTEFNVRAYPEDPSVQVVVAGGRVSFGPLGEEQAPAPAVLAPGELGELAAGATEVARRRVDPAVYLGWREGRLSFEDAPLSQVAAQLERWYGVPVRIADASLRGRRLTASFRDQPLEEVVSVVATSLGLEIARVGQVYTFYPKGRAPALAKS